VALSDARKKVPDAPTDEYKTLDIPTHGGILAGIKQTREELRYVPFLFLYLENE